MKKIVYITLLIAVSSFFFAGCSQKLTDIQAEYLKLLKEPATSESVWIAGDFLEKNLKRFDSYNADQMVIAYEDYIYSIDSEGLNYNEFLERFVQYISQPLKSLYEIKLNEQESPMIIESKLVKSWDELSGRALFLEVFIKENKNYPLIQEEAVVIYEQYLKAMLMGTAETPIFSFDGGNFNEAAQNAYMDLIAAYPDTTTAYILEKYFEYLSSINYALDNKDVAEITIFSDTCTHLVSEAGKRLCKR